MVTTPKPFQPPSTFQPLHLRWEKLPDDYPIPDDPVDNFNQPLLAAALTDALRTAGRLSETILTPTNYPLCVTYNDQIVLKAPDWAYIPQISVPRPEVNRSYTPNLQGALPLIVLEFISDTDGGEYSIRPTTPIGKWFFYERILKVPIYGIFDPEGGLLELYRLKSNSPQAGLPTSPQTNPQAANADRRYELEIPDENGRHWLPELQLFLGPWRGELPGERSGYWLRWWDEQGNLLLWGSEKAKLEQQRADQEQQRADQEQQRADQEQQRADAIQQQLETAQQKAEQLAALLRQQGIDPDDFLPRTNS
jgi:Putative restriction endonuclease